MAEQEVIKHTKAVYKAWNNPHTSWKHKAKEILVEILIIVFAVSLSIWLHSWSEKSHDHEEASEFLTGLKSDLQNDIEEMQSDRNSYEHVLKGTQYFLKVSHGQKLDTDSLHEYSFLFFNTTNLSPNISRFEGLKASGKLNIIENKKLLDDILSLYQEDFPFLTMLNNNFNIYKQGAFAERLDNSLVIDSTDHANWEEVIRMPPIRNALYRAQGAKEIIAQYDTTIVHAKKIITEIEEEEK